jgi:three-Cys-motif partner protein
MSKKPRDGSVGPWAAEKLEALSRALNYYTTRLKNQSHWQKIYIDAFAGPGLSEVRSKPREDGGQSLQLFADQSTDPEEQEVVFLKGSPRVALDIANPFDRYVFIDKDSDRVAELEGIRSEYRGRRTIEIRQGNANSILQEQLKSISKAKHRGYIFLDPFGLQVPWGTIEAIAKTGAIEAIVNFPLGMALRRMMPNSGDVPVGCGRFRSTRSSDHPIGANMPTKRVLICLGNELSRLPILRTACLPGTGDASRMRSAMCQRRSW